MGVGMAQQILIKVEILINQIIQRFEHRIAKLEKLNTAFPGSAF